MSEVDRLQNYYPFTTQTAEVVAEVAERFRALNDWNELYSDFQADDSHAKLAEKTYTPAHGSPIKLVDIVPVEHDKTLMYHLPMGNSVDANMQARLITLSAVLPNTRIIAAGNPAQPFTDSGKLNQYQRKEVSSGNFRSTVDPILAYAHQERLERIDQVGFSYGADKALAAAILARCFDITPDSVIPMDPASVTPRTLFQLGADFLATNKYLSEYVDAAEFPAYIDARKVAGRKTGWLAGYGLGLMRQSNIAIAKGIATGNFEDKLSQALEHNPETRTSVVWGTESELAIDGIMQAATGQAQITFGQRVTVMPVEGQHHAMGDDVFLHAALVREGLSQSPHLS